MSSFSWLDHSERDRRQMLDVIALFREKATRDELGIGTVRDAFSDMLFPGTSTIQTRARYFLFIPWIFLRLEDKNTSSHDIAAKTRAQEVRLINALLRSGSTEGLIGRIARGKLKRMPSAIYWQGLQRWGIRYFPGDLRQYYRSLDHFYSQQRRVKAENSENELAERLPRNWHAGLPDAPPYFPDGVTFDLTSSEAQYLRERIRSSAPTTLLAFLVDRGRLEDFAAGAALPWEHPQLGDYPGDIRSQLGHAQNFSEVFHGAALLYNLMLAEKGVELDKPWQEAADGYRERLDEWARLLRERESALASWQWSGAKSAFWETVFSENPAIPLGTQAFVEQWLRLALQDGGYSALADNPTARELIRRREFHLKGTAARLHEPRALDLWQGEAGTARLSYRWNTAAVIVADILQGEMAPQGEVAAHA